MNLISFLFLLFERHRESVRKLSVAVSVKASLLRIFSRTPFDPLEYKCTEYIWSWWEEASLKSQRQSSIAGEHGRKASWCVMKQTCQNPSKTRQARLCESAPKSKATIFSRCLYAKTPPLLERRGLGCTLPGRGRGGRGGAVTLSMYYCQASHRQRAWTTVASGTLKVISLFLKEPQFMSR